MLSKRERSGRVQMFQNACEDAGFHSVAPDVYELRKGFPSTLAICTLIHGNEIGGIEVLLTLLEEIHSQKLIPKNNLRVILGNVNAYYEDKRFLESDMNRSFGLTDHKTQEELRARELEKFLLDSDVLIDIHQTIGETRTPFYIFEYDKASYNLARYLEPQLPVVTNTIQRNFKGKTSTGFMISHKKMGVTIETGRKNIEGKQISLALRITRKAIETDFKMPLPQADLSNTFTFHQIINNPDGSLEMVKKLSNFDPVTKDELLAKSSLKEIRSEVDGVILFPKYGDYAKASMELALILSPVNSHEELE